MENQEPPSDLKQGIYIAPTAFFIYSDVGVPTFEDINMHRANSITEIDSNINVSGLWETFGTSMKEILIGNPYFLSEFTFSTQNELKEKADDIDGKLFSLIFYLWFIKDNSAFIVFANYYGGTGMANTIVKTTQYSKADGSFSPTSFSLEELNKGLSILRKYLGTEPKESPNYIVQSHEEYSHLTLSVPGGEYNIRHRLQRAMAFLTNSRVEHELPAKISNYVLIFECLFSGNTTTEVAHKIGERIAFYLRDTFSERLTVYRDIKKLYDIRSKYVHGQKMSDKFDSNEKLKPHSIKADGYAREILTKVIMNDSAVFTDPDDNKLTDYLDRLVFGGNVSLNTDTPPSSD